MRVLIGYSRCSYSHDAFAMRGHDVWTCDLRPAEHANHLQCDVHEVLNDQWDMAIFHPMCTYLTLSAAWAFNDPDFTRYPGKGYHQKPDPDTLVGEARRAAREAALVNFRKLLALPYPKAIENPAPSFLNRAIRPPCQIIQPYDFGDDASKGTGLWLDRLPPLRSSVARVPGRIVVHNGKRVERWANQTDSGQNRLGKSDDRWLKRSDTFSGIARAFGECWG